MSDSSMRASWPFPFPLAPVCRGDCHPELPRASEYHRGAGKGSVTCEEGALLFGLVCALRPALIVETGTETGYSAAWIAAALSAIGCGRLVTIEREAETAKAAERWLDGCGIGGVQVVVGVAAEVIRSGEYIGIGFAFLDSAIEARATEALELKPYLLPGAIVAVHDSSPLHPMRHGHNVDAELMAVGYDVIHIDTPRGITMARVRV